MNFDSHKPIYLQISDHICEKILMEEYQEDERIPSVREFGTILGVNPNTVMRSFEHLKGAEVLFDRRGVGFFIAPGAKSKVMELYREEFFNIELPEIIKKINLLQIDTKKVIESIENRTNSDKLQ